MSHELKKSIIRLAHSKPNLRKPLLALLRKTAFDLSPDLLESLKVVHESRRVSPRLERDISKAYSVLDARGKGYIVGDEEDEIDRIRGIGKMIGTADHGLVAVYWNPGYLTLVADKNGPWAVDVKL